MKKEEYELLTNYKESISRNKNYDFFSGETGKHLRVLHTRLSALQKELVFALANNKLSCSREADTIKVEITADSVGYKRVSLLNEYDVAYLSLQDKKLKDFFKKI